MQTWPTSGFSQINETWIGDQLDNFANCSASGQTRGLIKVGPVQQFLRRKKELEQNKPLNFFLPRFRVFIFHLVALISLKPETQKNEKKPNLWFQLPKNFCGPALNGRPELTMRRRLGPETHIKIF